MRKHQDGYIWRVGNSWFGRWRDDVLEDGKVVRKQRSKRLAEVCDRYRTERDVRPLLDEILRPLNQGRVRPESTLVVTDYVEQFYLPNTKENCKPSTYSAYKTQWEMYLAARLKTISLRDFRTSDAARLLDDIHRAHGLGRSTLRHLKSFLSGVFGYAINQGVMDGINPLREARIPKKASAPAETHVASPDEVLAIMDAPSKGRREQSACCSRLDVLFGFAARRSAGSLLDGL